PTAASSNGRMRHHRRPGRSRGAHRHCLPTPWEHPLFETARARSRTQTCVMRKHGHGWRCDRDMRDSTRASTMRHLHLRKRLTKTLVITPMIIAVPTRLMFVTARDVQNAALHNFGNTPYWTTAQLRTLSSSLSNPLTPLGKIITVVLDLYALTVVSTLAGIFGAFFLRKTDSHHEDETSAGTGS